MDNVDIFEKMTATRSRSTVATYMPELRKFWSYVDPQTVFDSHAVNVEFIKRHLTTSKLNEYLVSLKNRKKRPIGKSGLAHARSALVWLACTLAQEDLVEERVYLALRNVQAPRAESGQNPGRWLMADEAVQVIEASASTSCKKQLNIRNEALITLALMTGMRRSELSQCCWSDVHLGSQQQALIEVHGKGSKHRTIKLVEPAISALERWRHTHPDPNLQHPVFVDPLHPTRYLKALSPAYIRQIVVDVGHHAKIGDLSLHDLRRSHARIAFENGTPLTSIQQGLGHKSVQTTEKYVNARLELEHSATDLIAELLDIESFSLRRITKP